MNASQISFLNTQISNEANKVDALFHSEINIWVLNNQKCKLLILGEAPLSAKQYFYQSPGGFLSFLKKPYGLGKISPPSFLSFLRGKGILTMDIYQWPLPTLYYDSDKKLVLYDDAFLENRIAYLKGNNILDDDTHVVYRYEKLINRGIPKQPALLNSLTYGQHHINKPIAIGANAAILNPTMRHLIP